MGDRFASGPATDTMYPMAPPCTSSAPTDTKPYPAGSRVGVLLPLPLEGAYDYRVPDNIALGPGDFVVVPLGGRQSIGVIWGKGEGAVDEGRDESPGEGGRAGQAEEDTVQAQKEASPLGRFDL